MKTRQSLGSPEHRQLTKGVVTQTAVAALWTASLLHPWPGPPREERDLGLNVEADFSLVFVLSRFLFSGSQTETVCPRRAFGKCLETFLVGWVAINI